MWLFTDPVFLAGQVNIRQSCSTCTKRLFSYSHFFNSPHARTPAKAHIRGYDIWRGVQKSQKPHLILAWRDVTSLEKNIAVLDPWFKFIYPHHPQPGRPESSMKNIIIIIIITSLTNLHYSPSLAYLIPKIPFFLPSFHLFDSQVVHSSLLFVFHSS